MQDKLPSAYKKAASAKQFFEQLPPWQTVTALPDSPGDLIARLAVIISSGLTVGCLAAIFSNASLLALVPIALVVVVAGAIALFAAAGDSSKQGYLLVALASFAVAVVGGVL